MGCCKYRLTDLKEMDMKNLRKQLAKQWRQLRNRVTKVRDGLGGQKSPDPASYKEVTMNIKWNHVAAQWARFHGKAKEQWGELTERELLEVNGRFDVLAEKIQEKYGIERAEARQQIDQWTAYLQV
jgi:uncharacterized protein YjbJ (UPF0337 family)